MKEDDNHCDVVLAAASRGFGGQSFGAHAGLFDGVSDDGHHVVIAHGVPETIACHHLEGQSRKIFE